MFCGKCDKDFAQCECPDMPERWASIKTSQHLFVGPEYAARIQGNADRILQARERAKEEKGHAE